MEQAKQTQVDYKLYQINRRPRRAAVSHKVNSGEAIDKQSHPAPCSITGVISTINRSRREGAVWAGGRGGSDRFHARKQMSRGTAP